MSALFELLPVHHRRKDAEQGGPLRALLGVIQEQADLLDRDIAGLYENWFIETCEDWAVPYLGDLVGFEPLLGPGDLSEVQSARGRLRERRLIPRRAVANLVRDRRRKGTLALLEDLAEDVAGWPARAVEFYRLLAWNQALNHLRLHRGGTVDLRRGDALDRLGGAFEESARTVDVRRIVSPRTPGRYDIPEVGLFLWRLNAYSVSGTPACCVEAVGTHCYTFSVLGHDTPLFTNPRPQRDPSQIAGELDLPVPIRRRAFEVRADDGAPMGGIQASADYVGDSAADPKSLLIFAPDWPKKGAPQPIPRELLIPADLSDWSYRVPQGFLAVDATLGRMVFPSTQLPRRGVRVHYRYGFSADMGGGEYPRPLAEPHEHTLYRVGEGEDFPTIRGALEQWAKENPKPASAVIEIQDSGVYTEPVNVALAPGEYLQIRAASERRPILRLLDYQSDLPDAFSVTGGAGSRFVLDGLLVTGRGLRIYGDGTERTDDLCEARFRHCTLVPGWGLDCDCAPTHPNDPSLTLAGTSARIVVEHSILGAITVVADEVKTDPAVLELSDSLLDATSLDRAALGCQNLPFAFVRATFRRCTVFGSVAAHAIDLAEDSLFMGPVTVARRQVGCMRFCYAPPGSRTPKRFHCQPDLSVQALGSAPGPSGVLIAQGGALPRFASLRYGTPAYGQLSNACPEGIRTGAQDQSEMGAFHDLYQPQRAAHLQGRLEEFTPAGMEAGILFVN